MQKEPKKIHFIAIGGSVMHNLAITLHKQGWQVSGSDDAIFSPSDKKLSMHGLLPPSIGWYPEKITSDLDYVIVGMHARPDNPELQRANSLDLNVLSFPDFIRLHCDHKQRIVIAGSHGKTTITAMIMHVLRHHKRSFDYLVGAHIEGFEETVKISDDAPVIIIEGDEYPTSPEDKAPKFIKYEHHIAVISGIAWDHFNVYPDFEAYTRQFELLAAATPKAGVIIYNEEDDLVTLIAKQERDDVLTIAYKAHPFEISDNKTFLLTDYGKVEVQLFGYHNMQNLAAAKAVTERMGITPRLFYDAIGQFKGADRRLELVRSTPDTHVFKDFAHAPSKLKASTEAVKNQYKGYQLTAVLELHTFSSINKDFIHQFQGTFSDADDAIIFYQPKTSEHKKVEVLSADAIKAAFGREDLKLFENRYDLEDYLKNKNWKKRNLLLMSSGNFDGMDIPALTEKILNP